MDFSHWNLLDNLSINQAAALYCEIDPNSIDGYCQEELIARINLVGDVLVKHAINIQGKAQGVDLGYDENFDIDWNYSFLARNILKEFFISKKQRPEFLFHSENNDSEELFDKAGTSYPPELDLAIQAWRAVTASEGKGKPKAKIKAWLDANTKLSNEAKERIAIVANWEKTGGATTTG